MHRYLNDAKLVSVERIFENFLMAQKAYKIENRRLPKKMD
jgi:hypothetical protein